jgi:ketosteroid isomerase-like protein
MGRNFGIYVFAVVAGCALLIPGISHADEQEDRAALSKIRGIYEEVVKTDDLTKLMPYLAEDLSAVTPTGEEVKSPQELQAYFKKVWGMIGKGGTYEVKANLGRTDFYGDIAVSSGTTDESIRSAAGNDFKQLGLWTAVTRKIDGQWKVIRMHGSMDPLTNSFVTTFRAAELKITKLIYGLGGLGVGLLVGFGFHFLRRRAAAQ